MISALAWVPRGAAKPVVEEARSPDEELADIEVRYIARPTVWSSIRTYT